MLRGFLRVMLALAGLTGCLLTCAPVPASATTGPSVALPPSRYKVPLQVAQRYAGVYVLASVAPAARIARCALGIEVNNQGFLFGYAQFYGYDLEGYRTLWLNVLYNFHQAAHGAIVFDLLGLGGSPLEGRVSVTRAPHGDLSGQIALPLGRYAIHWHKIKNSWSPAQG